jgi:hypothetical protein
MKRLIFYFLPLISSKVLNKSTSVIITNNEISNIKDILNTKLDLITGIKIKLLDKTIKNFNNYKHKKNLFYFLKLFFSFFFFSILVFLMMFKWTWLVSIEGIWFWKIRYDFLKSLYIEGEDGKKEIEILFNFFKKKYKNILEKANESDKNLIEEIINLISLVYKKRKKKGLKGEKSSSKSIIFFSFCSMFAIYKNSIIKQEEKIFFLKELKRRIEYLYIAKKKSAKTIKDNIYLFAFITKERTREIFEKHKLFIETENLYNLENKKKQCNNICDNILSSYLIFAVVSPFRFYKKQDQILKNMNFFIENYKNFKSLEESDEDFLFEYFSFLKNFTYYVYRWCTDKESKNIIKVMTSIINTSIKNNDIIESFKKKISEYNKKISKNKIKDFKDLKKVCEINNFNDIL